MSQIPKVCIISVSFFLISCGGGGSNSSEPIQQNNASSNTQNNSQTNAQTQIQAQTETEDVIKANFGEVRFGEAKFE